MTRLKLDYGVHFSDALAFVESDDIARKFMAKYKDRTYKEYTRAFCLFFNWLKIVKGITISPTEMLNKQLRFSRSNDIQERRWAANLAIEFCRDNPDFKGLSDTHARLHWNVIDQFFKSHDVSFCSTRNPLGTKMRRKYRSTPITREDARRIMGALNQRDRTIAMCMLQSGMGVKETLEKFNFMLDYIQAQIRAGAERIKIEFEERKGNGFSYFTFISRDAIQDLRKWLIERERWIRKNRLSLSSEAQKAIFISETGKIMTINNFEQNFQSQLYRKGIKTRAFEFVTHDLRKFFKTQSSLPERGIIDSRFVEFMMGHIKGLEAVGGTYDQSPHIYEKAVEREYEKLEPFINIFSGKATEEHRESAVRELSQEVKELKSGIKQQGDLIDLLMLQLPEKAWHKAFKTPKEEAQAILRALEIINPPSYRKYKKELEEKQEKPSP